VSAGVKPTGSIYLHCDPTMSHYLKAVMDGVFGWGNFRNEVVVFGWGNFRNEVVWCYRKWAVRAGQFVRNHDVLLLYSSGSTPTFNVQYIPVSDGTMKRWRGRKQQAVFADGIRYADSTNDEAKSPCPDWWPIWWPISIINPNAKERLG
jgi:site-specific DNA-methyltransferase (adenine-specific)